jgi:cobalt-zinc-cadmium efflux system outer membrane protein
MKQWFMITILTGLGASLNAASPAVAEVPLSFANAQEIILSRNAGLKSAQTETDAARAGVAQAGAIPNPDIEVNLDNFGANEIEASVGQTIELGDKRKLRTKAAQEEVDAVVNDRKLTRLKLEAEIVRRFIPIVITAQKLSVIDSIITITEVTRGQIQRRVDAGGSRMTDLVRIEIDIEQLQLERNEILSNNKQARLQFASLGSKQDTTLLNVTGELDVTTIPDLVSLQKSVENNPVLIAYAIEQARLETERNQLHADAVPDLNLSAGYLRNNTDHYNSPLFGFSMSIPLFNRNIAAQKQTELKQKAVGEQRENVHRLLIAEVEEIHSQVVMIDRKIKSLQSSTVPKAQQVYMMLQDYYNAGNATFLDITDAQSELLRLKLQLLDIQQERALGLADLMQTTATNIQIVKME